ncbi:MAG: iron-containing alcohol dehydrogenase [Thermoguttaceae bacterium]
MEQMLNYNFIAPGRIVFGWGRRKEVGLWGRSLGQRAFIVSGLPGSINDKFLSEIADHLRKDEIEAVAVALISHEPEVDDVDQLAEQLCQKNPASGDFMLAIGGGSAIDLAKAAGAMATNRQSRTITDYLENVGRDLKIVNEPLPVLAMPTTAGTGAEATKNAVISSYDPPFKKSLRDDRLMPKIALVDPELTENLPPDATAAGGMDAITQLFESYISLKSRPIPRALAIDGLKMAIPSIVELVKNPHSRRAREAMSHAALLSGMALANSGLGMAHGVAPALGIHCRVAHGLACAVMLPVALKVNSEVCAEQMAFLSQAIFNLGPNRSGNQAVETLICEIENICDLLGLPRRLSDLGVKREQIPALVKSSRGSSMSGNPRELTDEELTAILEEMF